MPAGPGRGKPTPSALVEVVTYPLVRHLDDVPAVLLERDDVLLPVVQLHEVQLNAQFESIKILEPGQYELNLMELYDREEYIIALQENGRYVIQVPDQWIGNDLDER